MSRQIDVGFFTNADMHAVLAKPTLDDAKLYAIERVEAFRAAHPGADQRNVDKAMKMIMTSRTTTLLACGVASFLLAHPSEDLKVIR